MEGQLLPNLEDPANLIQSVDDCPEPACFGFRAPNWQPRAGFAGTYDQHWQERRAPYLPDDYNSRFCNAAHPDLIYPGYLQGGEPVEITNMHPEGKLKFTLPYLKLVARDRKSTRLNSSHVAISYAVFCLKKKNMYQTLHTA